MARLPLMNPRTYRLRPDQIRWLKVRAELTDHKQEAILLRKIIDQAMNRTKRLG